MKVKECTYWLKMYLMGATYPCSSHVLEQRKKEHHDLSVEDNNILLTSTKEQKRNTLLYSFHRQTGGEEVCTFAPET
jgi:hypothetical protein